MAVRWVSPERRGVAASMSSNQPGKTELENVMLAALDVLGLGGFERSPSDVRGRPDAVYRADRVAVFVHGCYWHRCPICTDGAEVGGANAEKWAKKFEATVKRDKRNEELLCSDGWAVVIIWECSYKRNILECAEAVATAIGSQRKNGPEKAGGMFGPGREKG